MSSAGWRGGIAVLRAVPAIVLATHCLDGLKQTRGWEQCWEPRPAAWRTLSSCVGKGAVGLWAVTLSEPDGDASLDLHGRLLAPRSRTACVLLLPLAFFHRRQEEEDARGKAISRYIHQAFNDPYDSLTSADTNPLGRRNRLTAFNPLLDDDGDA